MAQVELRQVNMAANGTAELFSTDVTTGFRSKLTPVQFPSQVSIAIVSTDVNVRMRISTGSENILGTSPVPGGGTAGQFPNIQQQTYVTFLAAAGDELSCELENTTAGTPSVMAAISVEPL